MRRRVGQRIADPSVPEFAKLSDESAKVRLGSSDDMVYLGDNGELSDEQVSGLLGELLSPEELLRRILRPIVEQHSSPDDEETPQARLDKAVAAILGNVLKTGPKANAKADRQAAEVAKEYWLSYTGERKPRSLQAIIVNVLKRSGTDWPDDPERQHDAIGKVRRVFSRNKDQLLTAVSRKSDDAVLLFEANVNTIAECMKWLRLRN